MNNKNCPDCGSKDISTRIEKEHVPYLNNSDIIDEIAVDIPVRSCKRCGLRYTDEKAEAIRDKAVSK